MGEDPGDTPVDDVKIDAACVETDSAAAPSQRRLWCTRLSTAGRRTPESDS